MFDNIKKFYTLFQEGQEISHKEFWKKGQAYAQPIIAAIIMAIVGLAKAYGHELPVSDDLAYTIAGAIFFTVNSVLTIITSAKIGIKPSVPQAPIREAESPMRSVVETTETPAVELPHVPEADIGQEPAHTIDEDTRKRAAEWVRQHSVTSQHSVSGQYSATNGLSNDA